MANRYFKGIGEITEEMQSVIVGKLDDQIKPNELGERIVKLYQGDTSEYPFFESEGWTELTESEMIEELNKPSWNDSFIKVE